MYHDFRTFKKGVVSEDYMFTHMETKDLVLVSRNNGPYELGFVACPNWTSSRENKVKFVADEEFLDVREVIIMKDPKTFSQIMANRMKDEFLKLHATPTLRQLKSLNEGLIKNQEKILQNPNIYEK